MISGIDRRNLTSNKHKKGKYGILIVWKKKSYLKNVQYGRF